MKTMHLSIPATKEELKYIDDITQNIFSTLPPASAKSLHFALHEVIINSIQAGERCTAITEPNLDIHIDFSPTQVRVSVTDYFGGSPINFKDFSQPFEDDLFKENGRGILLISHLVDDFTWSNGPDDSFIITLVYNFDQHKYEEESL